MSDGDEEPTDAPEEPEETDEEAVDSAESEDAPDETEDAPEKSEGPGETAESGDEGEEDETVDPDHDLDVETFEERLDAAEADLDAAETEADLDDIEATLDAVEADLERADLPEADDEDEENPQEELEARLADLRERLETERGPYAEDVVESIAETRSTIEGARWTETGEEELREAVSAFVERVGEILDGVDASVDDESPEELTDELKAVERAVAAADLDPDGDAETIAELVEATEQLESDVDDAEEWDDLSVREKLDYQGFYDSIGQKHKDFPPEWSALKEWEQRDDVEMVLLLLDLMGDIEFMERHCLEALERMGNPEAVDAMLGRAERRDKPAISVLGKAGVASDEVLETLHEYADGDPGLQRVTLRALGEIGSEESTQPIANQLASDDASVRSRAARSLGLVGDPRAIEPLADLLEDDDESDSVRASAAWALVSIGTEDALEAAADYADHRSYIIQSEAETASEALGDGTETAPSA